MINKFPRRFLFKDPFQKSQKQLEKIKLKVDRELKDIEIVEGLSKRELQDRSIINERMIYGEQRRHFPKRNEDFDRKAA